MKLRSAVFNHQGSIPAKYTCDGDNISPPLEIRDVPASTVSLVLIMDDPDAMKPAGRVWDHWLIWNIPPDTKSIAENETPPGVVGSNTRLEAKYGGPCPPDGEHRYFFKLYALDAMLDIPALSDKANIESHIKGHIIEQAELIGKYKKK